jgi:hypothetical protein
MWRTFVPRWPVPHKTYARRWLPHQLALTVAIGTLLEFDYENASDRLTHDGLVGKAHGELGTAFDARRTVADYPVECHAQFGDRAGDAIFGERIVITRVPGREPGDQLRSWGQHRGLCLSDTDRESPIGVNRHGCNHD